MEGPVLREAPLLEGCRMQSYQLAALALEYFQISGLSMKRTSPDLSHVFGLVALLRPALSGRAVPVAYIGPRATPSGNSQLLQKKRKSCFTRCLSVTTYMQCLYKQASLHQNVFYFYGLSSESSSFNYILGYNFREKHVQPFF